MMQSRRKNNKTATHKPISCPAQHLDISIPSWCLCSNHSASLKGHRQGWRQMPDTSRCHLQNESLHDKTSKTTTGREAESKKCHIAEIESKVSGNWGRLFKELDIFSHLVGFSVEIASQQAERDATPQPSSNRRPILALVAWLESRFNLGGEHPCVTFCTHSPAKATQVLKTPTGTSGGTRVTKQTHALHTWEMVFTCGHQVYVWNGIMLTNMILVRLPISVCYFPKGEKKKLQQPKSW